MDDFAVLTSRTSHMCDNLKLSQRLCNQLHNAVPNRKVGQRRACAARQLPTRLGPRKVFEFRNKAVPLQWTGLKRVTRNRSRSTSILLDRRTMRQRSIPNESGFRSILYRSGDPCPEIVKVPTEKVDKGFVRINEKMSRANLEVVCGSKS
jgi:hypothetical protein